MCQCPKVQAIAEHGLVSIHCINALATRYTCVLVYRANPADGHGIVTLHDRCVTIPCPAFLAGVELNANDSMFGNDLDKHTGIQRGLSQQASPDGLPIRSLAVAVAATSGDFTLSDARFLNMQINEHQCKSLWNIIADP